MHEACACSDPVPRCRAVLWRARRRAALPRALAVTFCTYQTCPSPCPRCSVFIHLLLLLIVVALLCQPCTNGAVSPFLSLPGLSCQSQLLQGSFLLGVLPHLPLHPTASTSVWSLLNSISFSPCFKDALVFSKASKRFLMDKKQLKHKSSLICHKVLLRLEVYSPEGVTKPQQVRHAFPFEGIS